MNTTFLAVVEVYSTPVYTYEDEHMIVEDTLDQAYIEGFPANTPIPVRWVTFKTPANTVPARYLAYVVAGYVGLAAVIGLGLLIGHWTASAIGI